MIRFLYRCLTLKEDAFSNVSVWIATIGSITCLTLFIHSLIKYA